MANKFGNADGGGFNKETWLTPPHILAALGPFDLDPAQPLRHALGRRPPGTSSCPGTA